MPLIVVPAMHYSMLAHKIVAGNIAKLKKLGVAFIEPKVEEGKAKMPSIESIVAAVIATIGKRDLVGRKVAVISGATQEPLDDIRVITNRSTGETGVELAKAAHERGAQVELWMGRSEVPIPEHLKTVRFSSFKDLERLVKGKRFDIVFFPAAVSDYSPAKLPGKMPSDKAKVIIQLNRNPKLIDKMRGKLVVGFKAQSKVSDDELVKDAMALMKRSKCGLVVANKMEEVSRGKTRVLMVEPDGDVEEVSGTKIEVADRIVDKAVRMI